jgi:hypothetical protein
MSNTPPTCQGCTYHKINIAGDMCYRPKRFKSGKLIEPGPYGFSTAFETKGWDDRADGDACSENRIHYKPTEQVL